jgi:hypothetical protein
MGMGGGGGGGGQQGPMGPRLQISYAESNVQLISIGELLLCLTLYLILKPVRSPDLYVHLRTYRLPRKSSEC